MNRLSFLGVLSAVPFVGKALADLIDRQTIRSTATWYQPQWRVTLHNGPHDGAEVLVPPSKFIVCDSCSDRHEYMYAQGTGIPQNAYFVDEDYRWREGLIAQTSGIDINTPEGYAKVREIING